MYENPSRTAHHTTRAVISTKPVSHCAPYDASGDINKTRLALRTIRRYRGVSRAPRVSRAIARGRRGRGTRARPTHSPPNFADATHDDVCHLQLRADAARDGRERDAHATIDDRATIDGDPRRGGGREGGAGGAEGVDGAEVEPEHAVADFRWFHRRSVEKGAGARATRERRTRATIEARAGYATNLGVMIGAIGAPANGGGGANDARTMRRVSLRRGRRAIGGGSNARDDARAIARSGAVGWERLARGARGGFQRRRRRETDGCDDAFDACRLRSSTC